VVRVISYGSRGERHHWCTSVRSVFGRLLFPLVTGLVRLGWVVFGRKSTVPHQSQHTVGIHVNGAVVRDAIIVVRRRKNASRYSTVVSGGGVSTVRCTSALSGVAQGRRDV